MSNTLFVCSYRRLDDHVANLRPRRLISILGNEDGLPWPETQDAAHLRLAFDDVTRDSYFSRAATVEQIAELIAFCRQWDRRETLLIHCVAGISRSPAAALIALAVWNPGREMEAAGLLRKRAPQAWPNPRMIEIADVLLRRAGKLVEAAGRMPDPDRPAWDDLIELPGVLPSVSASASNS